MTPDENAGVFLCAPTIANEEPSLRTGDTMSLIASLALAGLLSANVPDDAVTTRSGFVPVAVPTLYYEATGKGDVVILIHGGQMDRRMWDRQFSNLAKEHHVIRYDVRGFGQSAAATMPYSDNDDLLALLNHLHVAKAHLVGLSLGGRISLDFALTHRERVQSTVLVGPGMSGFDWSKESQQSFMAVVNAIQHDGPQRAVEMWLKDPYMAPAMEHADIAPRLRELATDNMRAWLSNDALGRSIDPPAAKRLKSVRVPTLVIVGSRDVPDIQRIVERISREVPGVKKVVIEGAGHIVNMEKPDDFDQVLSEWLAQTSR
jgi:pimeloyl-ACP methyl ester carboxylesterase